MNELTTVFEITPGSSGVRADALFRLAITWLLLAILIAICMGNVNWPAYRRLAARGVSGRATVVELLPQAHDLVRYQYAVDGQTFQGQMQSWQPNPPFEQLRIGQSLVVFYDPRHPDASVLGDPKPILRNETVSVLLAAFGMPTLVVAVWAWRTSRRHEDRKVTTAAA
jgi:hypothetical protein